MHYDSCRSITLGQASFYATQGSSYTPVFLSVIFSTGIQH